MANMVNCTEVRPGNFYVWDGQLYLCQAIDLNKTAMAKMKVKLKSKNVRNGSITEVSLIGGDKVELVYVEKRKMGYLYDEGEAICFMDNETYEQVSVSQIAKAANVGIGTFYHYYESKIELFMNADYMMTQWNDYELIDSGEGEKLERFGKYIFADIIITFRAAYIFRFI